jgi:hypothetical protein
MIVQSLKNFFFPLILGIHCCPSPPKNRKWLETTVAWQFGETPSGIFPKKKENVLKKDIIHLQFSD